VNELAFINWVKAHLADPAWPDRVRVGIGDDMAVLDLAGRTVLFGSDMLVGGVHFDPERIDPEHLGHKAIAVCLSDCAAMGATPLAALISFAKPDTVPITVIQGMYRGLARTAEAFNCAIVGGDSCGGSKELTIDTAVIALADGVQPVLRAGARPGDTLYVTGKLGGAILGKHVSFTPRINEGRYLARHLAVHAMIDISDGLSSDLGHICRSSHCAAEIDEYLLANVVSDAAIERAKATGCEPSEHVLNDGEDFELLIATDANRDLLPKLPEYITLFPIGRIVEGCGVYLVRSDGRRAELAEKGYRHF